MLCLLICRFRLRTCLIGLGCEVWVGLLAVGLRILACLGFVQFFINFCWFFAGCFVIDLVVVVCYSGLVELWCDFAFVSLSAVTCGCCVVCGLVVWFDCFVCLLSVLL